MIRYNLEDSFECYEFLKEELSAEGKIKQALGPLFAFNQEKSAQAVLKQVDLLKSKDIHITREKLLEVKNFKFFSKRQLSI